MIKRIRYFFGAVLFIYKEGSQRPVSVNLIGTNSSRWFPYSQSPSLLFQPVLYSNELCLLPIKVTLMTASLALWLFLLLTHLDKHSFNQSKPQPLHQQSVPMEPIYPYGLIFDQPCMWPSALDSGFHYLRLSYSIKEPNCFFHSA